MELTQGSETSANYNLTPGKYPKERIKYSNHGESLKSRITWIIIINIIIIISSSSSSSSIIIVIIIIIIVINNKLDHG